MHVTELSVIYVLNSCGKLTQIFLFNATFEHQQGQKRSWWTGSRQTAGLTRLMKGRCAGRAALSGRPSQTRGKRKRTHNRENQRNSTTAPQLNWQTFCCQARVYLSLTNSKMLAFFLVMREDLTLRWRPEHETKMNESISSCHYLIPVQVSACLAHPLHPEQAHTHTHIYFKEVALSKVWFCNLVQRHSKSADLKSCSAFFNDVSGRHCWPNRGGRQQQKANVLKIPPNKSLSGEVEPTLCSVFSLEVQLLHLEPLRHNNLLSGRENHSLYTRDDTFA